MSWKLCIALVGGLLLTGCFTNTDIIYRKTRKVEAASRKDANQSPTEESFEDTSPAPVDGPLGDDCDGELQAVTHRLQFPARTGCNFGVAPNVLGVDEQVSAREIVEASLALPATGRVCDVTATADSAAFSYEDMALLTIEGYLLFASSNAVLPLLAPSDNTYVFDFARLVGKAVDDTQAPFCLGDDTCVVPSKSEAGPLQMTLEAGGISGLGAKLQQLKEVKLQLVSFGDDNAGDCSTSDLAVQVDLKVAL